MSSTSPRVLQNTSSRFLLLFLLTCWFIAAVWGLIANTQILVASKANQTAFSQVDNWQAEAGWARRINATGQTTQYKATFHYTYNGGDRLKVKTSHYTKSDGRPGYVSSLYAVTNKNSDHTVVELFNLIGPASLECSNNSKNKINENSKFYCTSIFSVKDDLKIELVIFDGAGSEPQFEVISQTRNLPFEQLKLLKVWLFLLLVSPLVWLIHKYETLSIRGLAVVAISIPFYLQPIYSAVFFIILVVNYLFARKFSTIGNYKVFLAVSSSLLLLFFFKAFKAILGIPFESYGALAFLLPIGTSYIFIRLIDLQLRWYRGEQSDLSFSKYILYILFPPTLLAGPIELVDRFYMERPKTLDYEFISYGFMRIVIGLFKKLILVQMVLGAALFESGLWSEVVSNPMDAGMSVIVFCVLAYLYAYLDLSSYSDMAIGTSRVLGYKVIENFNWPVLANNLAEFWRRWHMSLSEWCFRNIYFPVLMSTKTSYVAMITTMTAVGLWHDMSLSWLTWGLYHGVALAYLASKKKKAAKNTNASIMDRLENIGSILLTNIFVAAGFAFVSINDYSLAWEIFLCFFLSPIFAIL